MLKRNRKWLVKYKEAGSDDIHETSFTGYVNADYVINWFGLDDADVTWYEVKEVDNPNN